MQFNFCLFSKQGPAYGLLVKGFYFMGQLIASDAIGSKCD